MRLFYRPIVVQGRYESYAIDIMGWTTATFEQAVAEGSRPRMNALADLMRQCVNEFVEMNELRSLDAPPKPQDREVILYRYPTYTALGRAGNFYIYHRSESVLQFRTRGDAEEAQRAIQTNLSIFRRDNGLLEYNETRPSYFDENTGYRYIHQSEVQNASRRLLNQALFYATDDIMEKLQNSTMTPDGWDEVMFNYAQMKSEAIEFKKPSTQRAASWVKRWEVCLPQMSLLYYLGKLAKISFHPKYKEMIFPLALDAANLYTWLGYDETKNRTSEGELRFAANVEKVLECGQ